MTTQRKTWTHEEMVARGYIPYGDVAKSGNRVYRFERAGRVTSVVVITPAGHMHRR